MPRKITSSSQGLETEKVGGGGVMCDLLLDYRESYKEIQYLNKVAVLRKVKIICSNNDINIKGITNREQKNDKGDNKKEKK